MPTIYDSRRAQKVKQLNMVPKKKTVVPDKKIPVLINEKLIVYIDDPSKVEETLQKYKDK